MTSLGKTTDGTSSSASTMTKMAASKATASSFGTLTAGHARVWLTSGSTPVSMLVYADVAGAPGALLATSGSVTVSAVADTVTDFAFSGADQINIYPGTAYWYVVAWQDPGAASVVIAHDTTAGGRLEVTDFTYGSFPDPYGVGHALTGPVAAYLDYTTAVVGTARSVLGPVAASATGQRTTFGTASAALGFTAFAAHLETVHGTATANLGPLAASAAGFVPPVNAIPVAGPAFPSDDLFPSDLLFPYLPPSRPPNPNRPVVGFDVDFTQGPPSTPSEQRLSINVGYRRLAVRGWSTTRGRQYELDQIQAGTLTLDLPDPLEMLNPDNPDSPYNQGAQAYTVTPYRCIQVWAMWPSQPGTGNIINGLVDPSYDPTFEAGTGGWTIPPGRATGVGAVGQNTAAAWTGSTSLFVTQDSNGHEMGTSHTWRTAPGVTYTFSCWVYPLNATHVWVRVQDAADGISLSQAATVQAVWQRISVTWTAVDTLETVTIFGVVPGGGLNPAFYVDATMLNFGDIVEPFQVAGPVLYPIFTGYVERWPTAYDMNGLRALRPLEGVDALAVLSRTEIHQSYTAEITTDQPGVYFPLDNTTAPAGSENLGAGFGAAGRINNVVSASGQQNWGGDTNPDGTVAVSFTAQNPNDPPTLFPPDSFTEMAVLGGAVSLDSVNGFTVEVWARWVSGTVQVGTLELLAPGDPRGPEPNVPTIGWASFAANRLGLFYNANGDRRVRPLRHLPHRRRRLASPRGHRRRKQDHPVPRRRRRQQQPRNPCRAHRLQHLLHGRLGAVRGVAGADVVGPVRRLSRAAHPGSDQGALRPRQRVRRGDARLPGRAAARCLLGRRLGCGDR